MQFPRRLLGLVIFLFALCILAVAGCRDTQSAENDNTYDLVFQSGRGFDQGIYLANYSTGQIKRITPIELSAYSPTWSADGKKVAYIALPSNSQIGIDSIYITDLPSLQTNELNIPTMSISSLGGLSWSPDGHYIAFEASSPDDGHPILLIIDVNTQQIMNIGKGLGSPRWSPNGNLIAAIGSNDIGQTTGLCLITFADHNQQCFDLNKFSRLYDPSGTKSKIGNIWDPFWFPDGTRVGFIGSTQEGKGIFSVDISGIDIQEVLKPLALGLCNPNISQDARSIILAHCSEDIDGLYLFKFGSDQLTPLDFGPWAIFPSWRPTSQY